VRRWLALAWAFTLCWLLGCATPAPPATPLETPDPLAGYRFANAPRAPDNSSSLFVVLTFSGGGTRAAALSYGVLEELSRIEVQWDGRRRRLLDEVDLISAVSGGSVTAAYFALQGDRVFDDFEARFLHRDVEGELTRKLLNPGNWVRMLDPGFGRSDLVAEHFDGLLFDGATYATLLSRPGPFVIVSATDMAAGTSFEFIQEQFDLMCVDLARFPLSRAVAASAAVPVLLSPIVVPNHADRCPRPDLSWVDLARREGRLSPRQVHQIDRLTSYLDFDARPFIHLLDGGLSDNLGLRSPLDAVFLREGAWSLVQRVGIADVRKVVFIVVHASTGPDLRWNRSAAVPGLGQVLQALKDIPIDRYSFETKELLAASFERWAAEIKVQRKAAGDAAGDSIDFVMVNVDFEALADRTEREALRSIPTSWSLDADTVARIRGAARTLMDESRPFQNLLRDLGATHRSPRGGPQAEPSTTAPGP
jgi:NTE family protein